MARRMKLTSVFFAEEDREALAILCGLTGLGRSACIRVAIRDAARRAIETEKPETQRLRAQIHRYTKGAA